MSRQQQMVYSTLGILFGGLILLFGIDLHNKYSLGTTYETALKIRPSGIMIIVVGVAIFFISLLNILVLMMRKDK